MLVSVTGIRKMERGNLRAFADVQFGEDLTIRDFRVVQQPGQRQWVSMPVREWREGSGERMFAPVVELAEPLRSEVINAVLAAWRDFGGGNGNGTHAESKR